MYFCSGACLLYGEVVMATVGVAPIALTKIKIYFSTTSSNVLEQRPVYVGVV